MKRIQVIQVGNTFYYGGGVGITGIIARYPYRVRAGDPKSTANARIWFEGWCAECGIEPVETVPTAPSTRVVRLADLAADARAEAAGSRGRARRSS
jgi:hypothetical protein